MSNRKEIFRRNHPLQIQEVDLKKQVPPHIIFSEVVTVFRHYLLPMRRKGILRETLPNATAGEAQSIGYIELEYAVTHWYKKSN